ncbi:MAG: DnaJ domain-containing protein [Methanocella sp.]
MDFEKDYYAILGLENTATPDEIKRTYRGLVKQYHPDVNKASNATEIFNAISEAYEVLSDPKLRAEYDAHAVQHEHAKKPKSDGGIGGDLGHKVSRASPAQMRLERTLLLSLIVPGIFQIAGNEKKFGTLLLIVYIVFWALAIIFNVEIGVLAVLVWAVALLDAYGSFRKKMIE